MRVRLATVVTTALERGFFFLDVELHTLPSIGDRVAWGPGTADGKVRVLRHLVSAECAWLGFPHGEGAPLVEVWLVERYLGDTASSLDDASLWLGRDGWRLARVVKRRPLADEEPS